ncbi:inositol phosphorylceramide synthase [Nocardioides immobilis]|uniref:Inositol phosphorylceramide synthase n=2 Tax=Nocardioides immobilis TaxID=2049295 RepID=A0A417Y288_9ACTN|nr:inositol phosphorylceramide synthase [Nocardioides immobilis]
MGSLAVFVSIKYDRPLLDPEGSFLGPSYVRLPLLLLFGLGIDLIPRTMWLSRGRPTSIWPLVRERMRTHWGKERLILVALGVMCFYVTYVSYRNLKSNLPFVRDTNPDPMRTSPVSFDRELHVMDKILFFGQDPSTVLHTVFGDTATAYILSPIYLFFLPMVPIGVTAWMVWSRNISYGYWFVTSQCLAWSLGTFSYYLLPTLGPGIQYPSLYEDIAHTPTNDLLESITAARHRVLYDPEATEIVNSVAGFASLHCAITLLVALMVQYTINNKVVKWIVWINFALTVIATLYFGWHYVADDIAGVAIAIVSFYLGALASGQKFDRGLHSHPTTTTSKVPVDRD